MKRERTPQERMMAYLDDEMSPRQRREFEKVLDQHPELREELREMAGLIGATNRLHLRRPDPDVWDRYWEEIDSRLGRGVGWTIGLVGSVFLILYGFFKALAYAENDFVRAGILLMALGVVILFLVVLRGRLVEMPRDRYRKVRR